MSGYGCGIIYGYCGCYLFVDIISSVWQFIFIYGRDSIIIYQCIICVPNQSLYIHIYTTQFKYYITKVGTLFYFLYILWRLGWLMEFIGIYLCVHVAFSQRGFCNKIWSFLYLYTEHRNQGNSFLKLSSQILFIFAHIRL